MIVDVKNVTKKYGDIVALDGFNMEVQKGEIYGLLGPNGSGKTTTLNCILALLKCDEGKIKLFDEEMTPARYDLKARVGYVPQDISVFKDLRVYENIDFFCGLYIKDKMLRKRYVEEAIEFVGLQDFRKMYPKKLSGGLRRRLNLACGIVHKPELLIFDEPTVAVDPQSRNSILEGIRKLNEDGATVIYTSHYMEEVEQLCNNISIMDKGKILVTGDKYHLIKSVGLGEQLVLGGVDLSKENLKVLENISGVTKISVNADTATFYIKDRMAIAHILTYIENNNISFNKMNMLSPTLNDVFLEITGKELRDE